MKAIETHILKNVVLMVATGVAAGVILASCDETPVAKNPPLAEQEAHTIRFLAKSNDTATVRPSVWIIEIDGKKFVAVHECGVAPMEETSKPATELPQVN